MYDGFYILNLAVNPQVLLKNILLFDSQETTIKTNGGNIKREYANYQGLVFSFKNINVRLSGSFHKYFNEGKHNYNDFDVEQAKEVIRDICQKFDIDPQRTQLNTLEFGVNVVLPFPVSTVLDNLNSYKGKCFVREKGKDKDYCQCTNSQFYIKIYDKGKQYGLPENVLRFEIKAIKKQYFEGFNIPIYCLSDLFNDAICPKLGDLLTSTFDEILFNDNSIDCSSLSQQEQIIYYKGINPKTWEGKTTNERDKKKRQRAKEGFKTLLEKYRKGDDFKAITMSLIKEKILQMSRSYRNAEQNNIINLTAEKTLNVPFLHFKYNLGLGHNENIANKVKYCSGCGKPLEQHQSTYHNKECQKRKFERNKKSNLRNDFIKKYGNVSETISLF